MKVAALEGGVPPPAAHAGRPPREYFGNDEAGVAS